MNYTKRLLNKQTLTEPPIDTPKVEINVIYNYKRPEKTLLIIQMICLDIINLIIEIKHFKRLKMNGEKL